MRGTQNMERWVLPLAMLGLLTLLLYAAHKGY